MIAGAAKWGPLFNIRHATFLQGHLVQGQVQALSNRMDVRECYSRASRIHRYVKRYGHKLLGRAVLKTEDRNAKTIGMLLHTLKMIMVLDERFAA